MRHAAPDDSLRAPDGWPVVAVEEREGTPTRVEGHLDAYQRMWKSRPYRAATPPVIAPLDARLAPETIDW